MLQSAQAVRLREMADELGRMADEIDARTDSVFVPDHGPAERAPPASPKYLAARAQQEYKARRFRSKFLPEDMFGEPAWDILLDLFVNETNGRGTNISNACVASCVPPTTALRYVVALEERELITSEATKLDKRVRMVSFTEKGLRAMTEYLKGVLSLPSPHYVLADKANK